MRSGKTFRCYVVYIKGSVFDQEARRKGPYHWVAAGDADSARMLVWQKYVDEEIKIGEKVGKIVATPFPEDQAMKAQGIKGLPIDLGDA